MAKIIPEEDIKGIECRFATYIAPAEGSKDDYHLVKEVVHLKDGRITPNLKVIKNYKRPFGITKEAFRKHKEKKEWEDISKLRLYECTQTNLISSIAKALGNPGFKGSLKRLCNSPYVYGADITSTALIKRSYMDLYPELNTFHTVAVLDIETDMIWGTGEIIMLTISMMDKVVTAISKKFLGKCLEIAPLKLEALFDKYLGTYKKNRNINWEVIYCDSPGEIVVKSIKRAHTWMPDFIAIWNIDFDLPKMIHALEKESISPADVFSDPSVPPALRFFKYIKGPTQKVTASGKIKPLKNAEQWHVATCPASFYLIDAMCAYRQIRVGGQDEPSYALDFILQKVLGTRKLKFKETDHLSGPGWHIEMQTNYKLEYVIYNVFDCIGVEELDEKTKDLRLTLHGLAGCSDYARFNSQPRRLVDDLHHYVLKHRNMMIATTGEEMKHPFDDKVIGLGGWIVMLPAANVADNGLKIIKEHPELRSNARAHVGDLDVSASYPNGEVAFNISKGTTKKELISIEGVSEFQRRMQGINLSGGPTNSVEFCQMILSAPKLPDLLVKYKEHNEINIEPTDKSSIRTELSDVLGYLY